MLSTSKGPERIDTVTESSRVADALAREIPWRFSAGIPRNVVSRKPYGGVGPLLLNLDSGEFGSPWFGTVEDWQTLGGKVGLELGIRIPGSPGVFNLDQTNNYEPPPLPVEDPDKVLDAIVQGLGVKMEFGFDATCKYIGSEDKIRIPHRWMFEIGPGGPGGWFDALGHELMHASEPRLRWDGHPDVAELRAEIGSGYLCGLLGVNPLPRHLARHHDAHVCRWIRLMRADLSLLPSVTESACEAVAYLLRRSGRDIAWHHASWEEPCPR